MAVTPWAIRPEGPSGQGQSIGGDIIFPRGREGVAAPKRYADLTGNGEKQGIKSPCGNT